MPLPLAYFLTWTTYGTWLHGDERGSVDRSHNQFETPYLPPNTLRERTEQRTLQTSPIVLSDAMRRIVRDSIIEHCPFRQATLLALNVRTNHVHLVLACASPEPGDLEGRFKAHATRALREASLINDSTPPWTKRGSTRYLWDDESVYGAIRYVLKEQGPRDEFAVEGVRLRQ